MANPFGAFCEDFYINMRLGSQLHLPHNRETLLHFFEPIRPFLDDPSVNDIMINGPSQIYVEKKGLLYLTDGLLGLATGSGYLDLGILNHGMVDLPLTFKILANLPHIAGGAFGVFASACLGKQDR